MVDIFLSYAESDRQSAQNVARLLEGAGWSVWWDQKIRAGTRWRSAVAEALDAMTCMVVLWSKASVTSQWVNEEAELARRGGKLIPVLIDDVAPPIGFREVQCADLTRWNGMLDAPAFRELIQDIEAIAGPPPIAGASEGAGLVAAPVLSGRPRRSRGWALGLLLVVGLISLVGGLIAARDVFRAPMKGAVPAAVAPLPTAPAAVAPVIPPRDQASPTADQATGAAEPSIGHPTAFPGPTEAIAPTARPERSAPPATPTTKQAAQPAPLSDIQRAQRDSNTSAANPRCGALLNRLQLGEVISAADRSFLARECRN